MKFGIRTPSLTKRIAARTSPARFVRHSLGFKAPRGFGWFTNPKKAAYNRIYNRTTVKADNLIILGIILVGMLLWAIVSAILSIFSGLAMGSNTEALPLCPRCDSVMALRNGRRGKFYGCPSFPRCRGTRDYIGAEEAVVVDISAKKTDKICPKCGKGYDNTWGVCLDDQTKLV